MDSIVYFIALSILFIIGSLFSDRQSFPHENPVYLALLVFNLLCVGLFLRWCELLPFHMIMIALACSRSADWLMYSFVA